MSRTVYTRRVQRPRRLDSTPRDGTPPSDGAVSRLFATVVEGGYCIGCGVCAALSDSTIQIVFDQHGRLQAAPSTKPTCTSSHPDVLSVCPFSEHAPNETEIARRLYGALPYYDGVGYHAATYAGHVDEGQYRADGSSGGMATWILQELWTRNLIDAAIHVKPVQRSDGNPPLFQFAISVTPDGITRGAKSRYYPVEMSHVLRYVREHPGRYALVGIPCFVKAVRLLAVNEPLFQERILFTIGIICGHLKSARFAGMFSWQLGIAPEHIDTIDFRRKLAYGPANKYAVAVQPQSRRPEEAPIEVIQRNSDFFGHLWGHGLLKYTACDFCDDVLAETADITLGDAWLPKYLSDSAGTNVVVVRHAKLKEIIEQSRTTQRIHLEDISPSEVAASQAAGLRHRRQGLAYRLHLKDKKKQWRPPKRIEAGCAHLTWRSRIVYRLRQSLTSKSHVAYDRALRAGNFNLFRETMEPRMEVYDRLFVRRPTLFGVLGLSRYLLMIAWRRARRKLRPSR